MSNLKENLFALTSCYGIGNINEVSDKCYELLKDFAEIKRPDPMTVIAFIKGETDYTVMLDAHLDQVGFTVTDIDKNGFLTVSNAGGIDLRMLPSLPVVIHSKEKKPTGVFCSIPPHLSDGEKCFDDIKKLKIDSLLGEKAKDFISVGDFVTFKAETQEILNGKIVSSSLDDRAGVAALIDAAQKFKDKKPPVNIVLSLSNMEELGLRGARTSAFSVFPDEAIAVDVSFAAAPDVSKDSAKEMGKGAMIGISPTLDKALTNKLFKIAKENNIPYQTEVMSSATGTNADVISLTKSGIRTGLVSIPIRNMHTPSEVVSLDDIKNTSEILEKYILAGGLLNG